MDNSRIGSGHNEAIVCKVSEIPDAAAIKDPWACSLGRLTEQDVAKIVRDMLGALRIYVSETEITRAQDNLRAIVEQATF